MRLGPKYCSIAVLIFAAVLVGRVNAQTTTSGALSGVVIDETDAVIPDSTVEITDVAKGTTQSAKTDNEGVYQFSFLRPGRYMFKVIHPGFQEERKSITIQVGPPATVNVSLQVAKTSSELTVTDEAPIIQAETADVSSTLNQKQISEVPNPGNDLTYVAQTAPGVVMNTDLSNGSHFSILGMPANSYLLTTDGMSNNGTWNDTISGALGLLLGQNEIQEATVVGTGYSGQFGGAAGGNINYITKSGTNDFHGNAQYYWNGSAFNANYWFNDAFDAPRPFSIANQWAGSLGGPIKKDKLFFFIDSEGLRLQVSSTTLLSIPSHQFADATLNNIKNDKRFGLGSPTYAFYRKMFDLYDSSLLGPGVSAVQDGGFLDPLGCAGFVDPNIDPNDPHGLGKDVPCSVSFIKNRGRPSQDTLTSGRVDWNASRSDRVFLRLEHDSGVSAGYNDPVNSMFDQDWSGGWWKGEVVETRSFGPSVATQFLMGASFYSGMGGVKNLAKSLATFPTGLFFDGALPFANLGFSGGVDSSDRRYDFSGDLVKTWGKQKLGFGANFEHTHSNLSVDGWGGTGTLLPQSLLAFYQGGVDPAHPDTDFTLLSQSFPFQTSQRIASNHFGLYGQDEWHVRKSLSLTFALRAEHQSNPVCENRCFARLAGPFELISHDPNQPYKEAIVTNQRQAFVGTDRVLWSPRFSFAWQPFGVTHNTVLRGGVGIFYDPLALGLTSGLSDNPPLINIFNPVKNNLTPGETENLFKDAAASNTAFVNGFAAGETLAQIQASVPNFFPPGLTVPQQRLYSPQYQRWSLELQQALGNATSFSVGYFGHHGIHELVQNSAANAWGFGSLPAGRCSDPIPDCAPDPRFGVVTDLGTTAVSNYNGMVASFKHRMSRWSRGLLQLNYTYGHAFDEVSNGGLSNFTLYSPGNPQNPNNLRDAYGPADYDVRHSFNANYVWELPLKAAFGGHGPGSLVNGWQVSGTFFAHTGFPYTVYGGAMALGLPARNYPGVIYAVPVGPLGQQPPCGASAALTPSGARQPCLPEELLFPPNSPPTVNPSALFVQAGCETDFNRGHLPGPNGPCSGREVSFAQGRNHFRGLGYFSTDFTIMKSTKIPHWENSELRIGFQFFNILNHPNFGLPFIESSDPLLGVIGYMGQSSTTLLGNAQSSTSAVGTNQNGAARMIQSKAELKF
ncbi:MAG: carboxypeptidase regulatory-like domain-containing protein [Acidobacteriia bacterium]|nr:carboxypeptidase regulatory-like domain-containing protein [Terriglobia bacterium]